MLQYTFTHAGGQFCEVNWSGGPYLDSVGMLSNALPHLSTRVSLLPALLPALPSSLLPPDPHRSYTVRSAVDWGRLEE